MTGRFSGARAFRYRNYRLFFTGQAISLVGTWMQQVAQSWLVLQLTGDPLWLGLVATAQFGPVLVFGLFGGLIADHLPKRKTLIFTQTAAMILAFALFALTVTGTVQVWQVMLLAALLGVTNAIDMPTRQAFAVEMVGREDIANAVGLNSALFNASRIIGPAVAGVLIGIFDVSIAFLINGVSFLGVIGAYLVMRDDELHVLPHVARMEGVRDVFEHLAEGTRYVRNTPIVLLSTLVVGLVATVGMNFQVLVPALADDVLRVGASGFGLLMAASGVGSTVAALAVAFSPRVRPRIIAGGAIGLGLGSLVLGLSTSFPVSLLAMLGAGAGAIAMAVTANTTIQTNVPDQLRGRVMSVYTTIFAGSTPVGGLLMGGIASRFNVSVALLVGGVLSLLVGAVAWAWVSRLRPVAPRGLQAPTPMAAGQAGESPIAVARRR